MIVLFLYVDGFVASCLAVLRSRHVNIYINIIYICILFYILYKLYIYNIYIISVYHFTMLGMHNLLNVHVINFALMLVCCKGCKLNCNIYIES